METKFKKGDRVRLTAEAKEHGIRIGRSSFVETGTVVSTPRADSESLFVRPDGHKSASYYHQDFWELLPEESNESGEAAAVTSGERDRS